MSEDFLALAVESASSRRFEMAQALATIALAVEARRNNELFEKRNEMLAEANEMGRASRATYEQATEQALLTLEARAEEFLRKAWLRALKGNEDEDNGLV